MIDPISLLVRTPFYPHWLETMKKDAADLGLLFTISGNILEVGAGDGHRKTLFLEKYPAIHSYTATDYAEWDGEFSQIDQLIQRFGPSMQKMLGYHKRITLDKKCDAMDLPFKKNSFDVHMSFEVIEHISDPIKYFSEATRVVKPGGMIYVTVPFLYRMHGGEPEHYWDFFRYGFGTFHRIAQLNGLSVERLYSNTGFGTTLASLGNQFLIRKIVEGPVFMKLLLLPISPWYFLVLNCLGFLIDLSPDIRFSTRFHVVLRKNNSQKK